MTFSTVIRLSLLVMFPRLLLAQLFQGQVADNLTFQPLPYATIGIKGKPIGCLADQNGTFQIDLSTAIGIDTIVISHVGYKPKSLLMLEIRDARYDIKLSPVADQRMEPVIRTEPVNVELPKNLNPLTNCRAYSKSRRWVQDVAVETDATPLKLDKLMIHLTTGEFDSLQFRLYFLPYSVNHSVEVSAELVPDSTFFTGNKVQQAGCVPLTPYKLIIDPNGKVTLVWYQTGINK